MKFLKLIIFLFFLILFLYFLGVITTPMHIGKTTIRAALKSKSNVYIVGSSHVYWNFNPEIIEKISGMSTYLASSSSQTLEQSYFIIRKLIQKPETKVIFLETFMIKDKEHKKINGTSYNLVFDYLSLWDKLKANYYYVGKLDFSLVFNFYKYHRNWKKIKILKENIKNEKKQLGLKFTRGFHPLKGFVPHDNRNPNFNKKDYKKIPKGFFEKNLVVKKEKQINKKYEKILDELFKLCEKNNVKLILITSPFYFQKNSVKLTSEYSNYMTKIAKRNNSTLINFNYLYKELKLNRSYFKDSGHLNRYGAEVLGRHIGQYLKFMM